jgi:hypothetical protein
MPFKISGHSDDIVCISGDVEDEVSNGANIVIGIAEASEGQDAFGIRVKMRYVKGGVWQAGIEPIDEDVACPWPVTVTVERYTAVVNVDCPAGTPISWKKTRMK